MKYITNFLKVGCVALLAVLILAPGAFAQTAPDPPTDLEARAGAVDETTGDQHGRIALSWSPVAEANNGGFAVTDYIIEFTADPTDATSWAVVAVDETAPADPTAADAKYTLVHILPEEADGDPATASYNLTRHYRVKAVNVIGTGDPSAVAMATTHNVPAAPTDLAAVAGNATDADGAQNGRITVTFSPIDEANNGGLDVADTDAGYILQWALASDAADADWTAVTETAPDASATPPTTQFSFVHDLSGETPSHDLTRYYRVRSVNAAGEGMNSAVVSGTTHDVPAAPTGLTTGAVAVNADDAALNDIPVSWNAVPDANNGGLAITGYELQFLLDPPGTTWATATGGTNTVLVVAGKVDTTHTGLAENTTTPGTYYYRVRAISAVGMGDWSSVTPGVKLALPGVPTMFTARAVDQRDAINLFWEMPENDGEPDVTGYRLERADDDATTPGTPNDATWADLAPNFAGMAYPDRNATYGNTYHYRVSAINVVGTSAATEILSVISSNKALMPRNLAATRADDMMSIVLAWDGPVADDDGNPANGGSPITGWKIEVSTDAGATWADVEEDKPEHPDSEVLTTELGSEYRYPHDDVAEGTTYTYRVSAVNDAGPGHPSDVATASIDAVLPGVPTGLMATAAMDAPNIELTWMAPDDNGGAEITSWKIEVSEDYDATDAAAATWADVDIAVTFTEADDTADPVVVAHYDATHEGLNAGADYHYRVSATNSVGTGEPSDVAMATAVDIPNAPTGLTATADGENAINLAWTAPELAGDDASAITGWKIEVSEDYDGSVDPPTGTWADLDLTVTDPTGDETMHTASHTGLDPAATRHYRVSAMNDAGNTGEPSDVASATTMAAGVVTAIRYAVSEDGGTTGDCMSATAPCTLQAALDASADGGVDTVLVRIRRVGETATIGDDISIGKMLTLGVYVRGGTAASKGAVSFTGSVEFADGGDLMTHKDASIHFDE
ncbi:MAG: fibronectin type III domain-containing protein, partial [Bacteroidetes bacterium]|nr:fibronectin type III domain-containing protein [Bacteroidota bacterium]MDE2670905.1 fibronectin type III domain-containing protein [Bacteroidota bacterium]